MVNNPLFFSFVSHGGTLHGGRLTGHYVRRTTSRGIKNHPREIKQNVRVFG